MNTFHDAIVALIGKKVYILLDAKPVEMIIDSVIDDMVTLRFTDTSIRYRVVMHVTNVRLARDAA